MTDPDFGDTLDQGEGVAVQPTAGSLLRAARERQGMHIAVLATTIKVSTELRDRINAVAAEQGLTAGSLIEKVLEEYLWRQQVELAIRQMQSMTPEEKAEYMAEFEEWDVTLSDGLEDDPWEE